MKRVVKSSEDIFGMARVGFLDKHEVIEVYVNTNDAGNIPHFHLRDKNDWDKFHSCIKITSSEYFPHEGKEDELQASMRKALDKFMRSRVNSPKYSDKFDNNWQLVCFLWELNNSNMEIPDDATMPDYKELK